MRWTTYDRQGDSAGEEVHPVDDQRLSMLFRDAAGQPPPASFDRDDVLAASRRATAWRRSALVGGSLLGIAVLTGGVLLGGQFLVPRETSEAPTAAPAPPPPPPPQAGGRMLEPEPLSGMPPPGMPPRDPAAGCGPADPALSAELTEVLAERGAAPTGLTVPLPKSCPPGARAAGVPVPGGTLYVVLSPAATGSGDGRAGRPDGSLAHTTATGSGQLLSVLSVPAARAQPAPLADGVDELARELADRR